MTLWRGWGRTGEQVRRFLTVGELATAVHFLVILFLVDFSGWANPVGATVVGAMFGIVTSYLGNHRWVFRRTGRHAVYAPRFGGVYLVVLGVHWGVMAAIVELLHWHYAVGFCIATAIATVLTFTGNREVVFR